MGWIRKLPRWVWNNLGNLVMIASWFGAFGLTAWAAGAAEVFSQYAPLSWVVAGFIGLSVAMVSTVLLAWARRVWVRSSYDARMLPKGPLADPMARTFEGRRIYLNEFILPSHPYIDGKTFIDCEIIGPANLFLLANNRVDEPGMPVCDAVLLAPGKDFKNGIVLTGCSFRRCSFQRVTWFFSQSEYAHAKSVNWFNWITADPDIPELPMTYSEVSQAEALEHQSPIDTEAETTR